MFRRSRRKIILSIMGSLILLFAVTLSVILLASFGEIRHKNVEMLERYVAEYSLDEVTSKQTKADLPVEKMMGRREPPPSNERSDYQLTTFYSVALSDKDSVLAVDNEGRDAYQEEELVQIARKISSQDQRLGRMGNITYIVEDKEGYTLVAFMDNTVSEAGLKTMLRYVFLVGGLAILAMFFIASILAGFIISPLEENDRQQKRFISDASHELKTPLAIISSNTDVLELEHGSSKWTKNIQNQVERLTSLVNSLVAFSRMEEKDTVERVKFDLTNTLKSRINDFNELANFQKKFITTDIDSNLYYNGDQQATIQLMDILLENAIKYAPQNSDINISLKKNRRYATMRISNKANVKKGDLRKVFDRFYRLDESRNSHVKGYGIGLSMAQVIAEKHKEVIKAYAPEDGIFSIETRFTLDEKK